LVSSAVDLFVSCRKAIDKLRKEFLTADSDRAGLLNRNKFLRLVFRRKILCSPNNFLMFFLL
jgi:hypothetical protein